MKILVLFLLSIFTTGIVYALLSQDFVDLLNKRRVSYGLKSLQVDDRLSIFARLRAEYIISIQYCDRSHPGFKEMASKYFGIGYFKVVECLVWSYDMDIIEPGEALNILLKSKPHRDALFGDYDRIGVAYISNMSKKLKQVWVIILYKKTEPIIIEQKPIINYTIAGTKMILQIANIGGYRTQIYHNNQKIYDKTSDKPFTSITLTIQLYPFIPNKITIKSYGFNYGRKTIKPYKKTITVQGWIPEQLIYLKKILSFFKYLKMLGG